MADEVVEALEALVAGLRRNAERIEEAIAKTESLAAARATGQDWGAIIRAETRPSIVELIGKNLDDLYTSGGRLRRTLARALYQEGLSMEQIARLFGVTRQRVSALLRSDSERQATDLAEANGESGPFGSAAPAEIVEGVERL